MKWWWRAKIHPTWQWTTIFVGVVVGLACSGTMWSAWFAALSWWFVGGAFVAVSIWKSRRCMLVVALLGGCIVGLARGSGDSLSQAVYRQNFDKVVALTGAVSEDPDTDKTGATVLRLSQITSGSTRLPGKIWVTIKTKNTIKRSDSISLKGKLMPGFGNFSASLYTPVLLRVERPEPGDVALAVRDDFAEHVRKGISEPAASLGLGYLTGQRRSLPADLDTALKIAGLTHIVVASGYNLTILVRLVKRLFEKKSRYLTLYLSVILIGSFIAITGLSPSMTRAGFVALISLLAWYFGRKFHPVTLLAFAAAVTGMIEPSYVWGSLGWQLSFASFAGVMVLAPLLQAYFFGDKKPGIIRQVVGETLSAQLATAPLILYAFGQISNVALIANVLILPLVPFAMLLTAITGIIGYVMPFAVHVVGLPAQWLLDYMVWIAKSTAGVSWAQTEFQLPFYGILLAIVIFVVLCWYLWRASKYRLRDGNLVE